jgi:hypothetical protein
LICFLSLIIEPSAAQRLSSRGGATEQLGRITLDANSTSRGSGPTICGRRRWMGRRPVIGRQVTIV